MKTLAIKENKNPRSFNVAYKAIVSFNLALVLIALSILTFTILESFGAISFHDINEKLAPSVKTEIPATVG